jgi:cysteine-rich repeat protein
MSDPTRARRLALLAPMLVLAARAAPAGVLVHATQSARSGAFASERTLDVDPVELASLRGRSTATVEGFPLGGDGTVTLDVTRIRPFDATTRIEEVTASGVHAVPLPDDAYFSGSVRGAAESRVLLVASPDSVRGFVVRDGMTYPFGRDGLGVHRVYALADVDPAAFPGPPEFCANDLHPDSMLSVPVPRAAPRTPQATIGPNTVLEVEVAVETDNEFRDKFGSTVSATNYLTTLLAASNAIYEDDVKLRLKFSYIRLWSVTDPWTSTDTVSALNEVQAYWLNASNGMDAKAGPHDTVHFISGKPVQGGVAYLDAVCDHTYGFGVSQVYADSSTLANPDFYWDVLVVTHEIGHNLGTVHTHCYNPPLDHCYNAEPGCYSGSTSVPQGGGTVMSYCHLLAGGLGNVNLTFGPTVSTTIRDFATSVACLAIASTCGDGAVEGGEQCDDGNLVDGDGCSASCETEGICGDATVGAGEECDDGNTSSGDGCSATCQLETVCGNGVVEGVEQCDDGNTVSGDGCSSKCRFESVCGNAVVEGLEQCDDGNAVGGDGCSATCHFEQCGNHVLDVGEECDDGNVVSGDGCSATCVHEPLCGDGTLDDGEACDDGDTINGDGCSATCKLEPCQIMIPHQTAWAPAKVVSTPGMFALRTRFGVPSDALDLAAVADAGIHLFVDGATGARAMDVVVPGGAGWVAAGTRLRYRDPAGSAAGVRSIVIRAKGEGITTVDLKIASHGGEVADANDAPPTVTVLLGDDLAGEDGACGRYAFNGGACVKRGKKLTCR